MIDPDSLTIREEPFADAWAASEALRAAHSAEVGPRKGVDLNYNVPLLERLAAAGALVVVTVRSNGRLFGYAGAIVAPSLESTDHLQGNLNTFFVDRSMRGAGPRLLRGLVEVLRSKGCREITLWAGVRGSGPKAGALFRRMGAEPLGEVYSMILEA